MQWAVKEDFSIMAFNMLNEFIDDLIYLSVFVFFCFFDLYFHIMLAASAGLAMVLCEFSSKFEHLSLKFAHLALRLWV